MAGSGTTTWTLGLGSGFELSLVFGSVRGHCHTKASHTIHPEENQFEPKLVQSLLARVRSVHCGAYHTCALSYEKGVINDNGEPAGDLWVWELGFSFSVGLQRMGVMMAWGNQSCGRLGLQEKKMEKVIFKPRVVRAEWASIEAMGGTEAEEDRGDKKKVTAAALATLGDESISKALDSESAISEGSSHAEFGEDQDLEAARPRQQHILVAGEASAAWIRTSKKQQQLRTMLKEEPDSNKIGGQGCMRAGHRMQQTSPTAVAVHVWVLDA
eukprot:s2803_g7.t1